MAKRLTSIWVTERDDGKDWSFNPYGSRAEAVDIARRFTRALADGHRWRAVRFVRGTPPKEKT